MNGGSTLYERRRRGSAIIYSMIGMPLLLVMGLLAVDVGQIVLAESQLQLAVDSAARYAAAGLRDYGADEARTRAAAALIDNGVDPTLATVSFGLWDPGTHTFIPLEGLEASGGTAVRVVARRSADDASGIVPLFGALVGQGRAGAVASATAAIGEPVEVAIEAMASPYLAGMSSGDMIPFTGETHLDWAPDGSYWDDCGPAVVALDLEPGQVLYFRDVEGATGDFNSGMTYGLEGNLDRPDIGQSAVNGINTTWAPLNSLMGIFLDDRRPDVWEAQETRNYAWEGWREERVHEPLTKQVFFIGDGVSNADQRLQKFVVPEGATRLFLGLNDQDGYWWDNFGNYRTTVFSGDIRLVE